MSKTSIKERNKAIRLAWEREQKLVAEGKGTRDWSQEQQKDILDPDIGKAKDDNGRSFEGQHMKSAAEYPEYQGDPDNIQFLTRDEHLAAHKGSWQNPTNWYYLQGMNIWRLIKVVGKIRPIGTTIRKLKNSWISERINLFLAQRLILVSRCAVLLSAGRMKTKNRPKRNQSLQST